MTLPVILVLALLIGHVIGPSGSSSKSAQPSALPALSPSAPPSDAAAVAPCTKVLQALPVKLGDLAPRVVHPHPATPFVVAWGDPAVVLRCGVPRPAELRPDSSAQIFSVDGADGVFWLVHRGKTTTDWTSIDRAAYVEVSVPNSYTQPPITPLASAIGKALPRVCLPQAAQGQTPPPASKLCTHRK